MKSEDTGREIGCGRFEKGVSKAKTGRDLGLHEATVETIFSRPDKYKRQGKVVSTPLCLDGTANGRPRMAEMQHLLQLWIAYRNPRTNPSRLG